MKEKYKFAVLNIGNVICGLGLSLIAPFYPTYAEKFNLSNSLLGLIFAISPIGGFISSLIVGKLLNNQNQTNFLSIGMLIQALGLYQYPLLTLTQNRELFIILSLLGRLISGFGAQIFLTPLYAQIPLLFPESVDSKMAIAEFFSAFGYMIGPVIGSFLYSIGGFAFPFIIFASASLGMAIFIKIQFRPLEPSNQKNELEASLISTDIQDIGYWQLMKIFVVPSSFAITLGMCIAYAFYNPIYAIFFEEQFHVAPENVGYFMASTPLAYSLGAIVVPYLSMGRAIAISLGMMMVSICQFFMGPDPITQLQPNIYITLSAQTLSGFFSAFPYIFVLPHITSSLQQQFAKRHHEKCSSLASGLFNASISFGEFVGPIFSGILGDYCSFERSASYLGLYLFMTTLFFLPNICLSQQKKSIKQKIVYDEQL